MATSADICLGAVVAIIIVIISFTTWRRWRASRKPKFTYKTPASQDLILASEKLCTVLESIAVARSSPIPPDMLAGVQVISAPAARLVEGLKVPTPTYASIHAVYQSLCDSDEMYLRAADAYIAGGSAIGCSPLISIGKQIQYLVGAVHELGVALNLE